MKISRRTLMIAGGIVGGGLLVGAVGVVGGGAWLNSFDRRSMQQGALPDGERLVAQWILIEPDGSVRVISPHTEMGQGTHTSLLQIVLDELDADPARTTIEQAPADAAFSHSDVISGIVEELAQPPEWTHGFLERAAGRMAALMNLQFTGGSMAIRFTGWLGFRKAAASARMMLARAGADMLAVPVSEVATQDGRVVHAASGRSLHYGELAEAAALLPLPSEPVYKPRSDYKFIGTAFARPDLPDKVFGKPIYGIDRAVPGMRYAAVAPPPVAQGLVTGLSNRAEIEAMAGVEAVVVLDDCVVVVADKVWRAEWAARKAQVTADPPEGGPFTNEALAARRMAALQGDSLSSAASRGGSVAPMEGEGVIEARYTVPFLAHTPMEPLNCTMWEEGGKVHVATGTQGPLGTRVAAADALGRPLDEVEFHWHTMGGGFGRRNALVFASINWVTITGKVHKQVGGALKLTMSREAELRQSTYRPADAAILQARLGPDGRIADWRCRLWAPVAMPDEVLPLYDIPNVEVLSASADPALPFGFWRSVGASQSIYFIESFVDECARAAGADPVAYRRSMLSDPRAIRVLDAVSAQAGWEQRPQGPNRAYGVAMSGQFGSLIAQIVDVELVRGKPVVRTVWNAIDCGTAVNTGSVEAQVQGGVHYALSAALYGRIDFDEGGAIRQNNFHDYRAVTFRDAPRVVTQILDSPDAPVGGVGEVSGPGVAPAVANALATLSDRPRDLPLLA